MPELARNLRRTQSNLRPEAQHRWKACLRGPAPISSDFRMMDFGGVRGIEGVSNPVVTTLRPIIVGEVLFDQFPDGQRVLGGAPFNVAWNLQGLGFAPLLVSAVGSDDAGREVRSRMEAWGMDTSGLQRSAQWPTGRVQVEFSTPDSTNVESDVADSDTADSDTADSIPTEPNTTEPSYQILDHQAYDEIHYPSFASLSGGAAWSEGAPLIEEAHPPEGASLLYHGSLAFRNDPTRLTIRRLIRESGLPRFVDINLRAPWFDRDTVSELLKDAYWTKLNHGELEWIAESECTTAEEIRRAVDTLRQRFGGRLYFITCGEAGAYAFDASGAPHFTTAPTPDPMIDAVGAGDAFAAATIAGILRRRPLDDILPTAAQFAAHACTIQGATSGDRKHYNGWIAQS